MRLTIAAGFAVIFASSFADAQESSLVGKYSGSYQFGAKKTENRVVLTIQSVENGVIKGTLERYTSAMRGGSCGGDYPVEGTVENNKIRFKSTDKSGRGGDCTMGFSGAIEDGKLVGSVGASSLTLSK